jgi:hypothetical protein
VSVLKIVDAIAEELVSEYRGNTKSVIQAAVALLGDREGALGDLRRAVVATIGEDELNRLLSPEYAWECVWRNFSDAGFASLYTKREKEAKQRRDQARELAATRSV